MRHVGLSFHDRAEVLDQILTEYPQIEVVQIQFNYLDYDDIAVQSRKCYEVCRKHGKPVLVMEPVKGGSLVNLPEEAKKVLDDLHGGSPASYAIRFAAGFPGMMMVLSGMSDLEQMKDNLSYMRDFKPLNETELAAVQQSAGDLPQDEPDPLHGLPLLRRGLPQADLHPRSVRHHEHQAAPPRLERGLLLRGSPHRARPPRVGLPEMRQVREDLPAASAHPQAAGGGSQRI